MAGGSDPQGQTLGLVRRDLREDLLVTALMGFSTAFDRWTLEHWNSLSESDLLDLAETAVDGYRRLLQPGSGIEDAPGNGR